MGQNSLDLVLQGLILTDLLNASTFKIEHHLISLFSLTFNLTISLTGLDSESYCMLNPAMESISTTSMD